VSRPPAGRQRPKSSFDQCANFVPPPVSRPGIPLRYSREVPPRRQRHPFWKLRRLRQKCDAPETAAGSQLGPPAAPPKAAPPIPPTLRRHRRPAPRPSFGRSGPGQPRPVSAAPAPVSRRQLQAPPASCMSLAKRPAPPPPMSGITPGLSAEAPCLLAVAPDELPRRWKTSQPAASFGDGHPSTHGAASRRRTGTGQGPTSAWLFAGTAARAVRSTAAPTSRSHQTRPPQFSPHRRTSFSAAPAWRRTAGPAFRSTAAPHHSLFRHTAIPQYRHTAASSFAQHPLFRHTAIPTRRRFPLYHQIG